MAQGKDPEGRPVVDPASPDDLIPPDPAPPPETPASDAASASSPISPFREHVATVVAVVALALLAWFYVYMVTHVEVTDEILWARRREILTGVEAIVFAAAGFLFGSQVQRRAQGAQVDAAKEKAAEARRQARREELKAQRERANAEAAQKKSTRAEREAGQLAVAVLTAQEASSTRGPGGFSAQGVRSIEPTAEAAEDSGGHPIENLTTLRDLAQKVLAQDRDTE